MTRQAMVVSRKMDTPTAVVAMLGMASFPPSLGLLWGPSAEEREGGGGLKRGTRSQTVSA